MLVIGNFEISWFAVFTTIACYIGMFIACILRRLQKKRVSDIYVCITFGVPLGLFFGRLVYILFSGNVLSGFLQYIDLTNGGFGLYGVMFGVFLATVLAAKLYDVDNFGQLLDCLSVGGAFAYFNLSTTENEKQNSYNNFSLIPAVKFHWYRRAWFGSYSKLGAGLTFLPWREGKDRFQFNFQVSFLGLEAGPEFLRAFAEVGVGEQGIVVAGLRYRF